MVTGVIVLVLLVCLSAFFSGIESAFISLGEIDLIEIEKSDSKNSRILLNLLQKRERLLSTILVGNNLVNIGASALNTTLAIFYAPTMGVSPELSVTVSAIGLTLTILLFGEIVPKNLAIQHKKKIGLIVAPLIMLLTILLSPITFLFDRMSRF